MKLLIQQKFSLEIPHENKDDEIIIGLLTPISKKQKRENKQAFKEDETKAKKLQKDSLKLNRLAIKVDKASKSDMSEAELEKLYNEVDELSERVETKNEELQNEDIYEKVAKKQFNQSVKSEQLDRLIEICELMGYRQVLDVIHRDIQEGK